MKAIVLPRAGGTEQFRLVDVPKPALRPGDVRIKLTSISFKPPISLVGVFSVETVRRAHELLERSAVHGKLVMSAP